MQIQAFSFDSIRIDGVTYEHDVVIDGGIILSAPRLPG